MDGSRPDTAPPKPRPRAFLIYVAPALFWLLLIFIGGGADFGPPVEETGFPIDKVEHLIAFGVLAYLFFRALRHVTPGIGKRGLIALSAFLAIGAGGVLELYQLGLPHRSAELGDLLADAIGALLAAAWLNFRHDSGGAGSTQRGHAPTSTLAAGEKTE